MWCSPTRKGMSSASSSRATTSFAGCGFLGVVSCEGAHAVGDFWSAKYRLHVDLAPGDDTDQDAEVDRLLSLGATRVDIGQGEVGWVVLADPDGHEFCLDADR
jgi:hypothetical protein